MVNTLTFFPNLDVFIPEYEFIGSILNNQAISTGKSPVDTVHCTVTESPEFDDSSPKSNGVIFGGTNRNQWERQRNRMDELKYRIGW